MVSGFGFRVEEDPSPRIHTKSRVGGLVQNHWNVLRLELENERFHASSVRGVWGLEFGVWGFE